LGARQAAFMATAEESASIWKKFNAVGDSTFNEHALRIAFDQFRGASPRSMPSFAMTSNQRQQGSQGYGNDRHSHVMRYRTPRVFALFAGLNAIPKRSFLTEYSCRILPACYPVWRIGPL
jgi:hypothetical protein